MCTVSVKKICLSVQQNFFSHDKHQTHWITRIEHGEEQAWKLVIRFNDKTRVGHTLRILNAYQLNIKASICLISLTRCQHLLQTERTVQPNDARLLLPIASHSRKTDALYVLNHSGSEPARNPNEMPSKFHSNKVVFFVISLFSNP